MTIVDLAFFDLQTIITPVVERVRKNHTNGYTPKTARLHANTIIEATNAYVTKIESELRTENKKIEDQWVLVRQTLTLTFQRLKLNINVPQTPGKIVPRYTEVPLLSWLAQFNIPVGISSSENKSKMPEEFAFNVASKLEPLTGCTPEKINEFLSTIEFYDTELSAAGKIKLIKFVVYTKIKGEAKVRLGQEVPTTFKELQQACYNKILADESVDELQKRLLSARQSRYSLQAYTAHLSNLAERLACATIKKKKLTGEAAEGARKMCREMALTQFKFNCHKEVKVVVQSAMPDTLEDALQLAAASNLDAPPASMYHIQRNRRQFASNNRQNQPSRQQNYNNNNWQNNGRNNGSWQTTGNNNSGQNNYNSRQNYNNQGNSRQNSSNHTNRNGFNQQQQNGNRNQNNNNQRQQNWRNVNMVNTEQEN